MKKLISDYDGRHYGWMIGDYVVIKRRGGGYDLYKPNQEYLGYFETLKTARTLVIWMTYIEKGLTGGNEHD